MKMTQELAVLLDKLYNLKGEDNIIVSAIKKDIQDVENKIIAEASKQSKNELTKVETESQLSIFVTQKEAFCSTFTGIDNDTFNALNAIGVNLDITSMLRTIDENAPKYCDELNNKISDATTAIEDAKKARENLNEELNTLNEKLDNAKEDSQKLVSLLEQSLSPNVLERESLTAKYAKDVLNRFGVFSSSEVSTLAKVILFPEDGLIEYDETYDENEHIDFSKEYEEENEKSEIAEPVLEEVSSENSDSTLETYQNEKDNQEQDLTTQTYQEENVENEPTQILNITDFKTEEKNEEKNDEEATDEEVVIEDIHPVESNPIPTFDLTEEEIVLSPSERKDETTDEEDSKEKEEEPLDKYAEFKASLENIGLNVQKFNENNENTDEIFDKLMNLDIKHIEENYEILRSLNVDDDVIYQYRNNHIYLADMELNKKTTLLRAKSISENMIKDLILNPDSGFKEEYQVVEQRVTTIEDTNGELSDENIHLLALDVNKYNNNLSVLNNNGFEIDDKDLRNYQAVLYNSENINDDVEVLKNYLLSIQRKNGKYALGVFFKGPKDLLFDIDDVVENKLEDLLDAHPEVLANRVDSLIARTKYALANGDSIYEDEENGVFNKNIIDGLRFYRTYNQDVNEYMPRDRKDVNASLETLIGNSDDLVKALDNYYDETTLFKDITLNSKETDLFNNLKNTLENKLNVVSAHTHTYLINDVAISKNKVERNLSVLVKDRNDISGMEKSLILSAILYNLRQPEDVLKQIIDCYDNNESSKDGGAE